MTWEKAEDIPSEVILEYECGNKAVVTDSTVSKMGQTAHTLTVNQRCVQPRNQPRPVIIGNKG